MSPSYSRNKTKNIITTYLHLHRLAVNKLDAGDEIVEHHGALGARVENDAVDLTANCQR